MTQMVDAYPYDDIFPNGLRGLGPPSPPPPVEQEPQKIVPEAFRQLATRLEVTREALDTKNVLWRDAQGNMVVSDLETRDQELGKVATSQVDVCEQIVSKMYENGTLRITGKEFPISDTNNDSSVSYNADAMWMGEEE